MANVYQDLPPTSSNEQSPIIGTITYIDSNEVIKYADEKTFISQVKENYDHSPSRIKIDVITDNPAIHKSVDDIKHGLFLGYKNLPIEFYEKIISQEKELRELLPENEENKNLTKQVFSILQQAAKDFKYSISDLTKETITLKSKDGEIKRPLIPTIKDILWDYQDIFKEGNPVADKFNLVDEFRIKENIQTLEKYIPAIYKHNKTEAHLEINKGNIQVASEIHKVEYKSIDGNYTEQFPIDAGKEKLNESLASLQAHIKQDTNKEWQSNFNEQVKKTFVAAIKEGKAPWLKENSGTTLPAHNPINGQVYKKFNRIWLDVNQAMMNSNDSRWIPAKTLYQEDLQVKNDAKPVVITFARQNEDGGYDTKFLKVYNGKDIENFPPHIERTPNQDTPIKTYKPISMHPKDTLRADIVNYLNAQDQAAPFIPKGNSRTNQVADFLQNAKSGAIFHIARDAETTSEKFQSQLTKQPQKIVSKEISAERDD